MAVGNSDAATEDVSILRKNRRSISTKPSFCGKLDLIVYPNSINVARDTHTGNKAIELTQEKYVTSISYIINGPYEDKSFSNWFRYSKPQDSCPLL